MQSDIEKKIDGRVVAAFEDIINGLSSTARNEVLRTAQELVKAVWFGKIYAAMPADKTKASEYFLDAELELFLNEAVEECHKKVDSIAERVRNEFNR
jgi:hypothetical protein